jgi:hypothetical protein
MTVLLGTFHDDSVDDGGSEPKRGKTAEDNLNVEIDKRGGPTFSD